MRSTLESKESQPPKAFDNSRAHSTLHTQAWFLNSQKAKFSSSPNFNAYVKKDKNGGNLLIASYLHCADLDKAELLKPDVSTTPMKVHKVKLLNAPYGADCKNRMDALDKYAKEWHALISAKAMSTDDKTYSGLKMKLYEAAKTFSAMYPSEKPIGKDVLFSVSFHAY
jgi:hypothetical protein